MCLCTLFFSSSSSSHSSLAYILVSFLFLLSLLCCLFSFLSPLRPLRLVAVRYIEDETEIRKQKRNTLLSYTHRSYFVCSSSVSRFQYSVCCSILFCSLPFLRILFICYVISAVPCSLRCCSK